MEGSVGERRFLKILKGHRGLRPLESSTLMFHHIWMSCSADEAGGDGADLSLHPTNASHRTEQRRVSLAGLAEGFHSLSLENKTRQDVQNNVKIYIYIYI